jgi:hypothetical protein
MADRCARRIDPLREVDAAHRPWPPPVLARLPGDRTRECKASWGGGSVSALASASCIERNVGCSNILPVCEQTTVSVQSPGNSWAPGAYHLSLNVDGRASECTLNLDPSMAPEGLEGTCTESDVSWTLAPVCPQPPPVCNGNACMGSASSSNCLAGQYTMTVAIGSLEDPAASIARQVALAITVGDTNLVDAMVSPVATTTEPDGEGCGTCTNASAMVMVDTEG